MRRNGFLAFLKEKSFLIVLTLMLVSAGTMAALFSIGGDDVTKESPTAKQESQSLETPSIQEAAKKEEVPESRVVQRNTIAAKKADVSEIKVTEPSVNTEHAVLEAELEDQFLEAEEMAEVSAEDVVAEGFSESTLLNLSWPVEGEVVLEFSMDHSIYFPTLAQYQYNPAMIIGTAEGTEVFASAAGTVTEVGKSNEYCHYVTMDLGDGFEITYGQLFDISTEVGETLDAGARIAMVAYPTRNYTKEGENLYLKLTENGVPVDPELYLQK